MPRPATGSVVEPTKRSPSWAIRFQAYGKRRTVALGRPEDGWTRDRAEEALRHTLSDVERGIWQPRRAATIESPQESPPFDRFASEWFDGASAGWRESTRVDYLWRLSDHLLPHFADMPLSAITVEEVDKYRRAKVRESKELEAARQAEQARPAVKRKRLPRPMSNSSINKTIRLLAVILEQALEYGHIDRNTAQGRKRLLKESKPSRTFLQPDQVEALLVAAAELDVAARKGDTKRRRPLLAVLTLAGPRISEALDLRWRDVNLGAGRLRIIASKTDTGIREINLTPTLQEVLSEYRTRTRHHKPADYVFPTAEGKHDNPSNVRTRFLAPAVERANAALEEAGGEPMRGVTPHSLRRTFISLLLATGADVPYVMGQAGHSDPKMTLGIYAQVIATKTDHGAALDGLVGGVDWAGTGGKPEFDASVEGPVARP